MKTVHLTILTKVTRSARNALLIIGSSAMLTGCYVDVYGEYDTGYSGSNNYDVTDMRTQLIVDAALLPLALAAEAPYQVINPDSYTTPRSRILSRATVTETTYAYLFDNVDCAVDGSTQVTAEADTTSYSDGYTYVDIQTSAKANHCQVWRGYDLSTINSDLSYDTHGWYDDVNNRLSSITGELNGELILEWDDKRVQHRNIQADITELSYNDFAITLRSSTRLDNGYYFEQPSLTTLSTVHWYLGATHPHQGKLQFIRGLDWVTLSFESTGVWRTNSGGFSSFWSWSELGY